MSGNESKVNNLLRYADKLDSFFSSLWDISLNSLAGLGGKKVSLVEDYPEDQQLCLELYEEGGWQRSSSAAALAYVDSLLAKDMAEAVDELQTHAVPIRIQAWGCEIVLTYIGSDGHIAGHVSDTSGG